MNLLTTQISIDIEKSAFNLKNDENRIAAECAQKVLSHLKRHQLSGLKPEYNANIAILEEIIKIHKVQANQLIFASLKTA
ncbi:MAG: hypothetical protein ACJA08_001074 [Cyclobacteriaceae bacterium]|jgi:hypothetical protein